MKAKILKYLKSELEKVEDMNETINAAAANNPFGQSIDLEKVAREHIGSCELRVSVEIFQKNKINVLKQIIRDINEL